MKVILISVLALMFGGCATGQFGERATGGGASYAYERTEADGTHTRVTITSGRDVAGGNVEIGPDGVVKASAEATSGVSGSQALIGELIKRIPRVGQ